MVGTITISDDGTFSETIKVPDDAPIGETAIEVDGDFTLGRDLDFEVTQDSAPPTALNGPRFVYPENGQTLDYEGAYLFKVKPVEGASEYLWGFFQNGKMVWENYANERELSGTEYGIHPGTSAHNQFAKGEVDVWVRGLVDGRWTNATIITIGLQSKAVPPGKTPTPAKPTPTPTAEYAYWAGGDSFSSGEGAPEVRRVKTGPRDSRLLIYHYQDETDSPTNRCHRSKNAFAYKVQQELGKATGQNHKLILRACSGARIRNYAEPNQDQTNEPEQRHAIDPQQTRLVTFTFGGNDADFATVVGNCVTRFQLDNRPCMQHIENAVAATPVIKFAALYRKVLDDAPLARIMVVGYPRLADRDPTSGCTSPDFMPYSEKLQRAFNDIVDQLNLRMSAAVKEVNQEQPADDRRLTFVDVSEAFQGHGICAASKDRWVNLIVRDGPIEKYSSYQQSYHPNEKGQSRLAERVVECYTSGSCEAIQPRKYYDETYDVDELLSDKGDWLVWVKSYTYTRAGILVRVQYFNKSRQSLKLPCPPSTARNVYLEFHKDEYFKASRTICIEDEKVKPGEISEGSGIFNVKGMRGGEKFRIKWLDMPKSARIIMWK